MRVLLISPSFPPLHRTASIRVWSFAIGFANRGHDVHVVTTVKRDDQQGLELSDPRLTIHEVAIPRRPLIDGMRRAHARPMEEHVPGDAHGGGILREVKERTGVFSSVRMPDLTDPWVAPAARVAEVAGPWDCVMSSCGPYTAHLVALKLGSSRGRWIADYRDLWTTNPQFGGLYPFTLRERVLERRVLAQADAVTTVSEPMAEELRRSGSRRVHVIYNGFFEREVEPLDSSRAFAADDLVRVVYTGTIYPKQQDVQMVFRAIASSELLRKRLRLVVAGYAMPYWVDSAEACGVRANLELHGHVSRPEALRLQRDADALLAFEFEGAGEGVLSSKIFEYLRVSAPIVVTGKRGSIGRLVEETGRGCACSDVQAACQMLESIVQGRDPVSHPRDDTMIAGFARERQAERVVDIAESLAGLSPTKIHAL